MLSLIKFQEKQIKRFGVKCHLNHEISAKDILKLNPDVVVLATGSLPAIPMVDGIDRDIVLTYEDVLNEAPPPFKKALIIGGGTIGLELALHLAEYGCTVGVVEMLAKVGNGLEAMNKKIMLSKLKEAHVKIMTETKLLRIQATGVVVACNDGIEQFLETEKVIIATGTRPHNRLYKEIKPLGFEIHQIGDCLETRSAKAAIYEGAVLGRRI